MKPENFPDELLIQAGMVRAQLLIHTNTPKHCLRNLGHLHDWLRYSDDASR